MSSCAVILGDWGTSRLRLWLQHDGIVKDRVDGPGIGALPGPAGDVLRAATQDWRAATSVNRIVLCGMAGARNGLRETAYAGCPASPADWRRCASSGLFEGLRLDIAAGLACRDELGRDDLMRGEEAQVFGAMALTDRFQIEKATVLLPGTHSKWVTVEDGRILSLRTFLTGELFALLARSSLFAANTGTTEVGEEEGFAEGVSAGRHSPAVSGSLFHARAAQLRQGRTSGWARGYISGLLIASEIAQGDSEGMLPEAVTLIGAPSLCVRYSQVLELYGRRGERIDDEVCTIAGLETILAND